MRFWEDMWLGNQPLKDRFPTIYRISNLHNKPISSFASGLDLSTAPNPIPWDFNLVRNLRENEIADFCSILEVLEEVRLIEGKEDIRLWIPDRKGFFSCQSFFQSFMPNVPQAFPFFKAVWKTSVPRKVQFFSWLVVQERAPTCDRVRRRFPDIFFISKLVLPLQEEF